MAVEGLRLCFGCMNYVNDLNAACEICAANKYETNNRTLLACGSVVDGMYLVGKAIKTNAEHIIYMGKHVDENKRYFIKEYAPELLASRTQIGELIPKPGREAQYKTFMVDFLDMNQVLRKLNSVEGILPAEVITISNKTVYVVYPYSKLVTLEAYLETHWKLSWALCKTWVVPLCDLLINLHRNGVVHRGISLQTIYFDEDQNVFLWDFMIPCLRTKTTPGAYQLFDGFSAPEQYHSNKWQGEWTDVYSLACVLVRVLTGRPYKDLPGDFFEINSELNFQIPENVVRALKRALKKDYRERTQTVRQLKAELMQENRVGALLDETMVFNTDEVRLEIEKTSIEQEAEGFSESGKELKSAVKTFLMVGVGLILVGAVSGALFWILKGGASAEPQRLELKLAEPVAKTKRELDKVPNLVGEQYEDVVNSLDSTFLLRTREEYDEVVPKGVIISQTPMGGRHYDADELKIELVVSKGEEMIEMPDIINQDIGEVATKLDSLGVKYEKIFVEQEGVEPNVVYQVSKQAGEQVKKNKEKVLLYLRKV